MSDTLTEFIMTGKANFGDFARSLLNDLAKVFVHFAMFNAIAGLIPRCWRVLGIGAKMVLLLEAKVTPPTTFPDSVSLMAANGMAFGKNKIVPYAEKRNCFSTNVV